MQVFVTSVAESHFDEIIEYIEENWGTKTAKQFIQKADHIFNLLKEFPLMGQVENGDVRGIQLTNQNRIFYRIRNQKIIILAFFDVRQDPNKKFID